MYYNSSYKDKLPGIDAMSHAVMTKYDDFDDNLSRRLTKMVMQLFSHWKLTYEEQAILLGLSTSTHTSINRYKRGLSHIRLNQDTYDRIRFLLSIHKSLRTLFPMNRDLAYAWMKKPNAHFNYRTPLQVAIEQGFLGLASVHDYIESVKVH